MRLKSIMEWERKFCRYAVTQGYHIERVAASGRRQDGICDAIAIKDGVTWLTEIKTIDNHILYLKEPQIKRLIDTANKHKVRALLVVWFKNRTKRWHLIELEKVPKKIELRDNDVYATY